VTGGERLAGHSSWFGTTQRWGWFGGFEYELAAVGEDAAKYAHPLLDKDQIVRFVWASGNSDDWRTLGQTEVRLLVFCFFVFFFSTDESPRSSGNQFAE
jgi:hypothetical protein